MAAPTIKQIREGIAANLDAIPGVQANAYMSANPTMPSIEVFPEEVEYDGAMHRGMDDMRFTIRAFVSLITDKGGQLQLDKMLASAGSTSVKAAVEFDRTLGGVVEDLRVVSASGYRVYDLYGKGAVLGCEWSVEVIALGA